MLFNAGGTVAEAFWPLPLYILLDPRFGAASGHPIIRVFRMRPKPESGRRRQKIFSADVVAKIRKLVGQGLKPEEIAHDLGCTLGTLRVKCSHHQISLRRHSAAAARSTAGHMRVTIRVSGEVARRLVRQSREKGMSPPKFVARLIETIVQDNLYDAVIDPERKEVADAGLSV
jgi:hypothetical protein